MSRLERLAAILTANDNSDGPFELDPALLYGAGDDDGENEEEKGAGVGDAGNGKDERNGDAWFGDGLEWIGATDVYDEELLRLIQAGEVEEEEVVEEEVVVGEVDDDDEVGDHLRSSEVSGVVGSHVDDSVDREDVKAFPAWRPSRERLEARMEALRAEGEAKEMADCTFAPKTGRGPKTTTSFLSESSSELGSRLFLRRHDARREAALRRHREEAERQFREACTFAPRLVARRTGKEDGVPLAQRVGEEWRKKEAVLQRARERADVECTFAPVLNETSRRLVAARREGRGGRGGRGGCDRRDGSNDDDDQDDDDQDDGRVVVRKVACAHPVRDTVWDTERGVKVRVNKESERILERSGIPTKEGFHARQLHFAELVAKKREEMEAREREEMVQRANGFVAREVPESVIAASRDSGNARIEGRVESRAEWVARMTYGEVERIRMRREARKRELEAELGAFTPALNDASLAMCADLPSIRERSLRGTNGGDQTRDSAWLDPECTFAPDTRKAPVKGFYGRYRVPEASGRTDELRAMRPASAKADRVRAAMEQLEAEKLAREMEECTFAPRTNWGRVPMDGLGSVSLDEMPGMARFREKLAMQEMAAREKKAREDAVFGAGRGWRNELTVVEPFKLCGIGSCE